MQTTVNGKPGEWDAATWKLWKTRVAPGFLPEESCSTANYYTPRPYVDEYNRGSDKEGFVFIVHPGYHVCQWERTK